MKKSIGKKYIRSMIIKEMKNILEGEHSDASVNSDSEEALAATISALKSAASEEKPDKSMDTGMPPGEEDYYLGDFEDEANSLVYRAKMYGIGVDDIVAAMLSAASDEMRGGFNLQTILQSVQKWLASAQSERYRE